MVCVWRCLLNHLQTDKTHPCLSDASWLLLQVASSLFNSCPISWRHELVKCKCVLNTHLISSSMDNCLKKIDSPPSYNTHAYPSYYFKAGYWFTVHHLIAVVSTWPGVHFSASSFLFDGVCWGRGSNHSFLYYNLWQRTEITGLKCIFKENHRLELEGKSVFLYASYVGSICKKSGFVLLKNVPGVDIASLDKKSDGLLQLEGYS